MKTKRSIFIILCLSLLMIFSFSIYAAPEETAVPVPLPEESTQERTEETTGGQEEQEAEKKEAPYLTAIEFNGAVIDGEFSPETEKYMLIVEEGAQVQLKNYKASSYAVKLKISETYDGSGNVNGMKINIYDDDKNNSRTYTFKYSSVRNTAAGDNSLLSVLEFNFGELYPAFSPEVKKYTLHIPSDLEYLKIDAVPQDENARVSGPAEIILGKDQTAPVSVTVTSGDASSRTVYELSIKRLDMTIEQYKDAVNAPGFTTLIVKPLYQRPQFYITAGCAAFAVCAAAAVVLVVKRKGRDAAFLAGEDFFDWEN